MLQSNKPMLFLKQVTGSYTLKFSQYVVLWSHPGLRFTPGAASGFPWFFRALPVATWISLGQPGILLFVILYEWADLQKLFFWIEICLVIILLQRLWVSQPFTGDPIDFPKFPFVNVIILVFIIVGQCFHDLKDTLLI